MELPFIGSVVQFGNVFACEERVRIEGRGNWPPVRHLIQSHCPDVVQAAREHTDRNRFHMIIKEKWRQPFCWKGQSLHRRSDYHWLSANTSHTITRTVSVTLLKLCYSGDSLEVEMIESIAAWGSCWKGELLFLLLEWLWDWIGSFVIRVVHSSDICGSFCPPRQWRGDIFSIHIYSATKKHVPQAKRADKSPQLPEQSVNYWWRRQQQCSDKAAASH